MKKLHLLTATAGILLALAAPTFAATRTHRAVDAYASGTVDRSGAYYYGPQGGAARAQAPRTPVQVQRDLAPSYGPGVNLPYPDRPYGDPDSW